MKIYLKQQGDHLGEAPTSGELKSRAAGQVKHVAVAPAVEQGRHGGSLSRNNCSGCEVIVFKVSVSKCQVREVRWSDSQVEHVAVTAQSRAATVAVWEKRYF